MSHPIIRGNQETPWAVIKATHNTHPRLIKLDFPWFNGNKDTISWVCRVEQFFLSLSNSRRRTCGTWFILFRGRCSTMVPINQTRRRHYDLARVL